jgi:predicted nucleotidyltransferase
MKEALAETDKTMVLAKEKRMPSKKRPAPFAEKIPLIASIILESVDKKAIKKIIMFGSYAYGRPHKRSDIDICVIVPNNRKSRALYLKIAIALFENKIMPVDLLVYTEKNFNNGVKENERGIESVIKAKGKVVYG